MNLNLRTFAIGAVAMTVGLAACSGDSATRPAALVPDSEITAGIAADVGDAIATSVDLMNTDESDNTDVSLGIGAPDPNRRLDTECSGPDGQGWYTCRSTWRGLSLINRKRFWDGDMLALGWSQATDSVNHTHQLSGSYNQGWSPFRMVWVNRNDTANLTVDRQTTPVTHIWDRVGVRDDSTQIVRANTTRHWHYTAYDTASAVTFNTPRNQNPWPVSGSIVHNLTVLFEADGTRHTATRRMTRRAMITFNGTRYVTLQVGGLTCTLDLETHQVSDCQGS